MEENFEQPNQIEEVKKPFCKTMKGVGVIIVAVTVIFIILAIFLTKETTPTSSGTPSITEEEKAAFRQRVEDANVPALTEDEKASFRQRVEEANVPALTEEEKAAFRERVGI